MVKGHTQTAGDSMHSVIERAARRKEIFCQDQWCEIIRSAKVSIPKYELKQMNQDNIFDFKKLVNAKKWKKISISRIRLFKATETTLSYAESFSEEEKLIDLQDSAEPTELAYHCLLSINPDKKKDLEDLMRANLIPEEFHNFFIRIM